MTWESARSNMLDMCIGNQVVNQVNEGEDSEPTRVLKNARMGEGL
jgi:hypothetical protein